MPEKVPGSLSGIQTGHTWRVALGRLNSWPGQGVPNGRVKAVRPFGDATWCYTCPRTTGVTVFASP